jgi:tetratricopeptide (TPR) repeat protein
MYKKISQSAVNLYKKILSMRLVPETHDQFFFNSLIATIVIASLGFLPLAGVDGLFFKTLFLPIAGSLLLIIIGVQSLKQGYFLLPNKKISWGLLFFLAAMLASAIFAYAPRNALFGTLNVASSFVALFSLVIIFYTAIVSVKNFSRVLSVLMAIGSVFTIVFLHELLRLVFGVNFLSLGFLSTFTSSVIGSWTDFGLFSMLVVIFSILCLEVGKFIGKAKWVTLGVGILGIIGLFLTNITWIWILAGGILVIISIYIFSLAYWNSENASYEKGRVVPWYSLIFFVFVLVGIVFGGLVTSIISRVRPLTYNEVSPTAMITAKAGYVSLQQRPVTGVGIGSFDYLWNQVKPQVLSGTNVGSIEFSQGYSFVGTQLATTGILGIIAWLIFLGLVVRQYWVILKSGFKDSSDRFTKIIVITGSLILTVVACISVPGIALLVLWMIFLGALWGISDEQEHKISFIHDPRMSFFGIIAVLIFILVGGACIYITSRQTASVFAYSSSVKSFNNNDQNSGIQNLTRANQFWSTDLYNRILANQVLLQVQNLQPSQTLSKDALGREVQRILSIGLSYAEASTRFDPKNYRNWVSLGNVYQFFGDLKVEGSLDQAKEAYTKAKTISPHDRTLDLLFAQIESSAGNSDQATQIVQDSLKQQPTVDGFLWLYQKNIQAQNFNAAEENLSNALQVDSANVNINTELGILYFGQGKYQESIVTFERTLGLNRNQPYVFALLGVSYETIGQSDDAQKIFDFLRKQLPDTGDKLIQQARQQKAAGLGSVPAAVPADVTETQTPTPLPVNQ